MDSRKRGSPDANSVITIESHAGQRFMATIPARLNGSGLARPMPRSPQPRAEDPRAASALLPRRARRPAEVGWRRGGHGDESPCDWPDGHSGGRWTSCSSGIWEGDWALPDDRGVDAGARPLPRTGDSVTVRVDVPGMEPKDIHVNLQDNAHDPRGEEGREGGDQRDVLPLGSAARLLHPHDPASGERGRHEGERGVQERRRHHRVAQGPRSEGHGDPDQGHVIALHQNSRRAGHRGGSGRPPRQLRAETTPARLESRGPSAPKPWIPLLAFRPR